MSDPRYGARGGLRLELPGGSQVTALADVNDALAAEGARVESLDLGGAPDEVARLIAQQELRDAERERLLANFLLPRERLLKVIARAGREPNVPGGGSLTTFVSTHDYSYPALWTVEGDQDYSRFDRFHVNAAADGTGVDEVLQMLCGARLSILLRSREGAVFTLWLACPAPASGWLVTYNGGHPHQGRLSTAERGTKVVVQVIGPSRWEMRYDV